MDTIIIGGGQAGLVRRGVIQRRPSAVAVEGTDLIFSDGSRESPKSVIWSTGHAQTRDWIDLPGIPAMGEPPHIRGVTSIPGCYFVGLPGLHTKGSGFLGFVGRDTEFLAKHIQERMARLHRSKTSEGKTHHV
jgi:putative flavoprotein involved in K+ transport